MPPSHRSTPGGRLLTVEPSLTNKNVNANVRGVRPLLLESPDRAERFLLRSATSDSGAVVRCHVLTGMGGVGKTQLAADYAEEAWADGAGVDLLVWITASSRDAIVAGLARAGERVCGADPSEPELTAGTFLAWLQTTDRRWLVVLDDVADPKDVAGLWPPRIGHGRTVVTTRRRDRALISSGRQRLDVGVFTSVEAVAYLTSMLADDGRAEPVGELIGLAEDLGHLPLALSQAVAYVADADIPVSEYRETLARRAGTLADVSPDVPPDHQAHTMAAAWELSVDYADRLRPTGLARPMLELVAFLAPQGIPQAVLTSQPAIDYLEGHRTIPGVGGDAVAEAEEEAGEPVTAQTAVGALRALHRLSLLASPGTADREGDTAAPARSRTSGRCRSTRSCSAPPATPSPPCATKRP